MRRTPEALALSAVTRMSPMSPVRPTWVPPHSSTDQALLALPLVSDPDAPAPSGSPMETTRTSSPYFSPNSARAPVSRASSSAISRVSTGEFCST